MDDTQTMLVVAEPDEPTRGFLVDNLAADGYQPLGAQSARNPATKRTTMAPVTEMRDTGSRVHNHRDAIPALSIDESRLTLIELKRRRGSQQDLADVEAIEQLDQLDE